MKTRNRTKTGGSFYFTKRKRKNRKTKSQIRNPKSQIPNPKSRQSGMTLVQAIILTAIAAIIVIFALPPFLENRKVSQAVSDVEMLADACEEYFEDTGNYCTELEKLNKYLDEIPKNPWNGNYVLDTEKGKIGIARNDQKVPEKYRLGEIAEISKVYKEGASLW